MTTVLVTGASGFVGAYAVSALRRILGGDAKIIPTSRRGSTQTSIGVIEPLDVINDKAIRLTLQRLKPSLILHLAGIAAPGQATDAKAVWRIHVDGTLNLARAILDHTPECVLLYVGSGLVYGESARAGMPIKEETPLAPIGNYAFTKAAADVALGALAERGLRCVRLRPFNHTGPGQSENFFISAIAAQIARIEMRLMSPVLRVGNLDTIRDFLDVRDVAEAYALITSHSKEIAAGEVFNVASGQPRRICDVLNELLTFSKVQISVEPDPKRLRTDDIPCILGDATKLRKRFGWIPHYDLDHTLADVLSYWRERVKHMM